MLQAISGEGLAQGSYVARVSFERATFGTHGTEPTAEPLHLTFILRSFWVCQHQVDILALVDCSFLKSFEKPLLRCGNSILYSVHLAVMMKPLSGPIENDDTILTQRVYQTEHPSD